MSTDPLVAAVTAVAGQLGRLADVAEQGAHAAGPPPRPDSWAATLAAVRRGDTNTLVRLIAGLDHDERTELAETCEAAAAFIRARALPR